MSPNGKNTLALFAGKRSIKLGIHRLQIPDRLSFVFAEIDNNLGFIDDSRDWTH
jgi:hypothetical protein